MIAIKTTADLDRAAGLPPEIRARIALDLKLVDEAYPPGEHDRTQEGGYAVVIEPGDDLTDLAEHGLNPSNRGLVGVIKENVEDLGAYWYILVIMNNDFGVTFAVPKDLPGLPDVLRSELESLALPAHQAGVGGAA